jgi:hypothetical protein
MERFLVMGKEVKVLYKNVVCILIWKYENGFCEVEWGEEVILVHRTDLEWIG